jgi:hypothetical protein
MNPSRPQSLLDELTKLENLRNPQSQAKRRQFQRYVVRGDAELVNMDRVEINEPHIHVMLRDISRCGMGFLTDSEIEVGSTWRLRLMQRRYVIADAPVVVRHRRAVNSVYLVGAQICCDNGLLFLMGVDPVAVREGDSPTVTSASAAFLAPDDVN